VLRRGFYLWRLCWTALAFAALGLGGFVLAMAVIPVATLFVRDGQSRSRRAQAIIRNSFRLYLAILRAVGVLKVEVVGAEKLGACRGRLIIANHPTLIDIVLLMAMVPEAKCIVKPQLFRNPLLRELVRTAGYIRNDDEPEVLIEKCREILLAGSNLIVFPEGTRSVPGQSICFQRGFAHIATLTGVKLLPITITCEPVTLIKGEPFYKIPRSRPNFRLEVADEIDPARFLGAQSRARGARSLVAYLQADYCARLNHG
jgi:1-acyl-sn-glycerol-3-phosphate acyltransferase